MSTDLKQKAKELFAKGKQFHGDVKTVKEKYEKYKEMVELGKNLIDPDTRAATVFKEALGFLMSRAGKLLGTNLTKHPYFILNQAGIEALFEAIIASDTINNARKQLDKAETELNKLARAAVDFETRWDKSLYLRKAAITSMMTTHSSIRFDWTDAMRKRNTHRYRNWRRDVAAFDMAAHLRWAETLLDDLRGDVTLVLQLSEASFGEYAALSAAAADIILAEKTYVEKIEKLSKSTRTLGHTMGVAEKRRRLMEQGFDMLDNKNGGGKSYAERVATTMDGATQTMRSWRHLVETCLSERILTMGMAPWVGYDLPWDMPLPAK